MRRTRGEAGSEAEVEPRRAVRRHAWFRRRPGSSRVREDGLLQRMLSKLRSALESGAGRSRVEEAWRVAGWRGSRSCGCARSRVAAGEQEAAQELFDS